jgi:hypothetical protein
MIAARAMAWKPPFMANSMMVMVCLLFTNGDPPIMRVTEMITDFADLGAKRFNEAAFWARLRRHWPSKVVVRRIEDASGNRGTFDTFLAVSRPAYLDMISKDFSDFAPDETPRRPKHRTTPDIDACRNGGLAAWLELKVGSAGSKPLLRPGQDTFAAMIMDAGIPCAYLVGSPGGEMRLIDGATNGSDWRRHLLGAWQTVDILTVRQMIVRLMAPPG